MAPGPPRRSTVKTKKAKQGSSQKRQKTAPSRQEPLATPFYSLLTGEQYSFDGVAQRELTTLCCTPITKEGELPDSTGPFLFKTAQPFCNTVQDVLCGPDFVIINIDISDECWDEYYTFVRSKYLKVPNSTVTLEISTESMDDLLKPYIEPRKLTRHLKATGWQNDTTSDDSSMQESTSEPEPYNPIPPWERTNEPKPSTSKVAAPLKQVTPYNPIPPWERTNEPNPSTSKVAAPLKQVAPAKPAHASSPKSASAKTNQQPPTEPPATVAGLLPDAPPEAGSDDTMMEQQEPEPQTQSSTRKPRTRWAKVDFNKIDVVIPQQKEFTTILYKPTQAGQTLKGINPMFTYRTFVTYGFQPQNIRDIRDGGIAVDFLPDVPSNEVLQITTIQDRQVSASLPKKDTGSQGVIKGVHWEIPTEDILAAIETFPPTEVRSVRRLAKPGQQSYVVKVDFAANTIPEKATFFGRSYRITNYVNKPLLCFKCGRYGHSIRVCRSTLRCWTCSLDHATKDCTNKATPTCCSCNGPHPTDSTSCPSYNLQNKICETKAAHNIPFKLARKAVTAAAKTYSAALKGPTAPTASSKNHAAPANSQQPNYKPNVAHHGPPAPDTTAAMLSTLFKGLIAILTTAATTNDLAAALVQITELFKAQAPDAAPDAFLATV